MGLNHSPEDQEHIYAMLLFFRLLKLQLNYLPWKPNEIIAKIIIIIIRKETQLRRWMWAFMAHLSTIDKDSFI